MEKQHKHTFKWIAAIVLSMIAGACANIGNPSGGPRDEDPPILVSANPPEGATNVTRTNMTLTFNELVNVKDAFSKVVMSPAGRPPRITSQGKHVVIRFDSLAPNTTYTIDFADAIEDNNESNKLQNFAYTFSTGDVLDTLRIAGRVLGARDLEPRPGILVGVTDDTTDSVFMRTPLLRVAKTDDRGRFIVRGLAPGNYRVFALDDKDADFMYTADNEEAAFYPVTVSPGSERVEALDTVYNKLTGAVDTVTSRMRTRYLPNDLLLRSFLSDRIVQYVSRYERPDSARLFFKMNAPAARLPRMRLLDVPGDFRGVVESREGMDSITVWLPADLARVDTLALAVDYSRSEWGKEPVAVVDTLKFITKRQPKSRKKGKEKRLSPQDSIAAITTSFRASGESQQEIWKPFLFESATPLARLDTTGIHLLVQRDSTMRPVTKRFRLSVPDTAAPRSYRLDFPWEYEAKYQLKIDSLAGTDIYGKPTLPFSADISVRPASEYCSLSLNITGLDPGMPAFVELLDGSDRPVRTAVVENGHVFCPFLQRGKYYARIIEDQNGNGLYDTGDFQTGRQPDLAYYYPKAINIKKNWDKEETWDLWATAIDQQKPRAVLENNPAQTKKGNRNQNTNEYDEEDEEIFDPTANPFEERRSKRNNRNGNNRNGLF